MSGDVIDFPIVHTVTRKVDIEAIVDRKLCALSARAGVTPEQFIWGCIIEALSDLEDMTSLEFIRKYLEPTSGDPTNTHQAKCPT